MCFILPKLVRMPTKEVLLLMNLRYEALESENLVLHALLIHLKFHNTLYLNCLGDINIMCGTQCLTTI